MRVPRGCRAGSVGVQPAVRPWRFGGRSGRREVGGGHNVTLAPSSTTTAAGWSVFESLGNSRRPAPIDCYDVWRFRSISRQSRQPRRRLAASCRCGAAGAVPSRSACGRVGRRAAGGAAVAVPARVGRRAAGSVGGQTAVRPCRCHAGPVGAVQPALPCRCRGSAIPGRSVGVRASGVSPPTEPAHRQGQPTGSAIPGRSVAVRASWASPQTGPAHPEGQTTER